MSSPFSTHEPFAWTLVNEKDFTGFPVPKDPGALLPDILLALVRFVE
jgi:hypothetical protein